MSISDKLTSLQNTIEDIRQSIVNKDVPVATTDGFKAYPDAVRAINFQNYTDTSLKPTIHGVNYYDYNGDLLYVYTPQEFLALSAHPSQPLHTGLVADGWNWDLVDAQDFIENTCDCLNIGAHYNTLNGNSEIYIETSGNLDEVYYWQLHYKIKRINSAAYQYTIDWGDGTQTVVTSGLTTSFANKSSAHTYSSGGNYCIKMWADTDNVIFGIGNSNSYTGAFGYGFTGARWRAGCLVKINLGNAKFSGCSTLYWYVNTEEIAVSNYEHSSTTEQEINGNAFFLAQKLKGVTIPKGILTAGNGTFEAGHNIKYISFPKGFGTSLGNSCFAGLYKTDSLIFAATCTHLGTSTFNGTSARRIYINGTYTSIPANCFYNNVFLEEITIANTVTTLGNAAFQSCGLLKHLEFEELTSVGQNCFNYCVSLRTIIIRAETPPTAGTTPFANCGSLVGIYVPYSSDHSILDAYKTATNWTTYASKIYELDENGNIPND